MKIMDALRDSRAIRGKSQEYMAFELGIARKTVQNWERGISEPSVGQALMWFKVLNVNPLPYFINIVYPEVKNEKTEHEERMLRDSLRTLLSVIPEEGLRQLLYLFYGEHGSSPRAVLNMVIAHLQTPMKDRVTNGTVIVKNYNLAVRKSMLTSQENIQPNLDIINRAIELGEEAAVRDESAYVFDIPKGKF